MLINDCCDTKFSPSSWDRKFPTLARNFFLWQEFFSCYNKFLPLTRNFFLLQKIFLWPEISYCGKKFLTVARNFFLWQNISCWGKYMFVITREFLPTFRVSLKISWEPGSLAPGEYPTLLLTMPTYGALLCRWVSPLSTF